MAVSRFCLLVFLLAVFPFFPAHAVTSPVGSTSGAFEVNNNGAATYTVPIQVPPGVNGVEPKLALVYNSQQGNGLVGVGWSLAGLQVISRCPGAIAVDGVRSTLSFSAARYCWNGQRLIPKTNTSGVQDTGSDSDGAFWEFRTEIESFARIRAYSSVTNPTKFKIWTKDGRILRFGFTTDSVINPQSKGRLIWALNREEDRKGNYLAITYTVSSDQSEYYPATIQYGGVGLENRSVSFAMDSTARADGIEKYVSGAKLVTSKRLKTITTSFGANTVRTYTLNYASESTGASRSLLQSIQECGSDGVCYANPLVFAARAAGSTSFTNATTASLISGTDGFGQWNRLIDMNGDGFMDVFKVTSRTNGTVQVLLGSASGSYTASPTTSGVLTDDDAGFQQWNELVDMNGDGIVDIFKVIKPTSGAVANAVIYLGNSNGTFSTTGITLSGAVTYGPQGFRYWNQLVDMNGDGLVDIFRVLPGTQSFAINYGYLQSGAYKATICANSDNSCWITGLATSNSSHGFRQTNQLADMDGDGIVDIFRVVIPGGGSNPADANAVNVLFGRATQDASIPGGKLSYVSLTTNQTIVSPIEFASAKYGGYFNYYNQLVDVNGDGITDVVRVQTSGSSEQHQYKLYRLNDVFTTTSPPTCRAPTDPRPCHTYDVYATVPTFTSQAVVRLGRGDGTFSAAISTNGIFDTAAITVVTGPIDSQDFINDRMNGTQTVVCQPPQQQQVTRTTTTNPPLTVTDINFTYRCRSAQDAGQKGISGSNQFADMDGDGYVDIVRYNPSSGAISIAYGNGDGTFKSPTGTLVTVTAASAGFNAWNQLADMNGDGMVDLFSVSGTTGTPRISARKVPGLLESATDGNGLATSVSYAPLTSSTVYSRTSGSDAYPSRKVQMPMYVAASSTVAATGFSYAQAYAYSDARIHLQRGWLGFAAVTRTDNSAALQTTTTFRQDYPYTGRPVQQTKRHTSASAGKYLSSTTYTWGERVDNTVNASGKVHFVYPAGSVQSIFEPNNNYALVQTITTAYLNRAVAGNYDALPYDRFGNPERVQVSYSDGHVVTTDYTSSYLTDGTTPSTLHLGQLSQQDTSVAHAVPAPGSETRTRVTRNIYYPADGLLQTSVSQPNASDADTALKISKSYAYNANGRVSLVSAAGADPAYDAAGGVSSNPTVTRSTTHAYTESPAGTLTDAMTIAVGGAASHSETAVFDARHGGQTSHADPAGIVTTWSYDGFGRKTAETRYSGVKPIVTGMDLLAPGGACPAITGVKYCVTVTTSGGATALSPVTSAYDALGRELRVLSRDALNNVVYKDTQYDSAGRLWRTSRPYYSGGSVQWTTNTYDLAGRPLTVTEPNAATTTYNYQGLITAATRAAAGETSQTTTTTVDSQGNVTRIRDALNKDTDYVYGAFGLLKRITDAKGNSIVYDNDIFGNRVTQTDPDTGTCLFRYNAFGELKWQKDAKAQLTAWQYDYRGRILSRTEGTGGAAATSVWTYDTGSVGAGRLDSVTRSGSGIDTVTQSYLYDTVGQPRTTTVTTGGTSYTATTDYDALERPQTVTYPDAALSVKYAYYPNGALKEITDSANPAIYYWKATAYNAEGQPTGESWGNGRTGTRSYDAATGALTAIATTGSVQDLSYTYYKLGNLRTRTNGLASVTETFGYDVLNRLTSATSTAPGATASTFSYDEIGNLTFKTGVGEYTYGSSRPHAVTQTDPDKRGDANDSGGLTTADTALILDGILHGTAPAGNPDCNSDGAVTVLDILCVNRHIVSPTHVYSYDANGNMTAGGGRSITYTAFNMPATVEYSGQRDTFTYGPDYARLTKEVKTVSTGEVSESTFYLGKLYERTTRGGTVEERFFITAGSRLVAQVNRSGGVSTKHYIHTDLLGSAETVTDASGAVVESLSFDAWGDVRQSTWQDGMPATAFDRTTRGYTGHEADVSSGLINMNARLYDPRLGRFVSADSIIPDLMDPQSMNRYAYVLNNPFQYVDPTGHAPYADADAYAAYLNEVNGVNPVFDNTLAQVLPSFDSLFDSWTTGGITTGVPCNGVGLECGAPVSGTFLVDTIAFSQNGCGGHAGMCHSGQSSAIAAVDWIEFGKGLFPGYDLYKAYQSTDATLLDYGIGVLGIIPLGKGAGIGIKAGKELFKDGVNVVDEASSLANAARLRGQLAGEEIAGGHAFERHVLQQGEFQGLGIRTRDQFARHIEDVINNPTAARELSGGRTAYWDDATSTVVIRNPRAVDGGTAFQPVNGRSYFDALR